jgi:hypothetical protein
MIDFSDRIPGHAYRHEIPPHLGILNAVKKTDRVISSCENMDHIKAAQIMVRLCGRHQTIYNHRWMSKWMKQLMNNLELKIAEISNKI